MRKIRLIGQINEKAYKKFSKKLDELLEDGHDLIEIELSSEGGHTYDALAIYGKIRTCPAPIRIIAHGLVMSAATIILAAGDFRAVSEECWIMLHDASDAFKGPVGAVQAKLGQMQAEEDQWAKLLELHSKTPKETWRALSQRTTYLTAAEAYQLGLIDEILKGKSR
jgi:ATP-dependent protease ClpP protease subunit